MKIALFSDIHANLPALEAVLADIDSKNLDAVYCLGDLVGYNIWPNEVIAEIRKRRIPTIAGNYDFGIGRSSDDCGCAYKTDDEKANVMFYIGYTNESIRDSERAYLRTLPAHIRLDFHLSNNPEHLWTSTETFGVLLVHGSPRRINEYLFEDREEKSLLRIFEQANADVICFGHTHKPYYRILAKEAEPERYFHAVNLGSVGKPKDGDPQACYVILTVSETAHTSRKDSIQVEFVRVAYDIEKAALAIEKSPLPDQYADSLRKAY
jgi:putative phosphoesterase